MIRKEKWLYLIANVILIWNLVYFIIANYLSSEVVLWSDVFKDSLLLSSTKILLLPLLSLLISLISIAVALFLNFKNYKTKQSKYLIAWIFLLSLSMAISLMLSFYSQISLAIYMDGGNSGLSISWLNSRSIWIIGGVVIVAKIVAIVEFAMNYNSLLKYNLLLENSFEDGTAFNLNSNLQNMKYNNKEPKTEYIPNINNVYAGYVNPSYNGSLSATMNIKSDDINDFYAKENLLQDNNIKPLIKENEKFNSLGVVNPLSNITPATMGFTQQIKNEYEKDFVLVQELHRINMAQSNAHVAKLINIFYNRYDRGLDLDVDRVMLLIYRVALEHEPLFGYLKDAILYKLDSKFISDLARKWFNSYANKVNNFYSTSRSAFKKSLNEGIIIMDNDIEKYLQESVPR
ncbi:hypothetical protein [Spiroplasma endosymbiont of Lonchoptera lutea]|uniref:hypothetical protein n=1 Tax=Spiroplasma endosymbiont of Lonchoptera lutea TaxID=3066297 RepID=UPI0030D13995